MAALWVNGALWRFLHWPGGTARLLIVACLSVLYGCVLAVWLGRSDIFSGLIAAKGDYAVHLRRTLIALSVTGSVLSIGIGFRLMHWPGGAYLIFLPAMAMTILLILTGIFGYLTAKN